MSKEKLLINDSKSNNGEVMRNKQIEEMACEMCGNEKICGGVGVEKCVIYPDYRRKANRLYNAGYRKQKEGEWIETPKRICAIKCGACGDEIDLDTGEDYLYWKYCPLCGAKMKGD